ncbi:MAG: hypothetical protein IJR34_07085 [Bacteroidales bacterium]|nr:hypothetical protein [Bacteroidales bacterium]
MTKMKKYLNYETPVSELLTLKIERNFLDSDDSLDRGNATAPQGYNGGSYGEQF